LNVTLINTVNTTGKWIPENQTVCSKL